MVDESKIISSFLLDSLLEEKGRVKETIMKLNEQNCKNVRLEKELSDVKRHIKEDKQVDKELLPRIQEELMTSKTIAKDHPVNGLFEISDSTLTSVNLLCNATCLLTWEVPKKNKKSQQFGTAFLCSLPVDYGYEVILVSAARNFVHLSDVSGNEGVPFSGYHLFFRNLEGVTEETVFNKMKKEGNTNGIRYWNLADFLSNFDVGINYNLIEDFILFRLRIATLS